MSSKKYERSHIGERILELSQMFSTNKEFLKKCGIPNQSLITDIKKGRSKTPGAEYLEKIVRGTGVSGTWLLTGEGKKFEARRNQDIPIAAEPTVNYLSSTMEELEKGGDLRSDELPPDFSLKVAKLLVKLLEHQHGG